MAKSVSSKKGQDKQTVAKLDGKRRRKEARAGLQVSGAIVLSPLGL